ncbi:hypothetical protein HDU96_008743, partial [Phlyctochytrium bullatum]
MPKRTPSHRIPSTAITIATSSPLGTGAFGSVFKAKFANETVAVKRLNRSALEDAAAACPGGRDRLVEAFEREAAILASLNHPRIVRFLGVVVDDDDDSIPGGGAGGFALVMEYLPLGSLFDHYRNTTPPPPLAQRMTFLLDIAAGMLHLHSRNPPLLHRDLKSLNILLAKDAQGVLHGKIADFGLAVARGGDEAIRRRATAWREGVD